MQGLFGRMFGVASARSAAGVPSYGMIPPMGSVASAAGLPVSQATAMAVSAVYCAVNTIAKDVARCVPSLYQANDDGTRTLLRAKDHPVAQLLKRPNHMQTWFEFMRDTTVAKLLRGNAYAAILRDKRNNPSELIWINPDAVMVLEATDGSVFYNVNRLGLFQIAMLRDFPVAIPAEDILHLRGISFNMLVGASTIGMARDTIGLATAQSQQQSRWMGNGAKPSVVLETAKQLSEDAAKRLRENWRDIHAGIQNVGGTAVLEDGVTAKVLQLTSVDLDFINQCNLTVQDIARFFGVPPRKLMQPDTSRGSTIIQEDQAYVNSTVGPELDIIEQKWTMAFDLDKAGLELDLNEDALLRADPLTRYNLGRIGKLSGLVTTNEWRRSERLPPVPGGDDLMQPVNMAALGSDATGTAPDGAGRPAEGKEPTPGVPTGGAATADDTAPEG